MVQELAENNFLKDFGQDAHRTTVKSTYMKGLNSPERHNVNHVSHSSGLAKTMLQEDIREWTGLEFTKSQKAVENREKWRKLVAKSSVVPQQPSQLRD